MLYLILMVEWFILFYKKEIKRWCSSRPIWHRSDSYRRTWAFVWKPFFESYIPAADRLDVCTARTATYASAIKSEWYGSEKNVQTRYFPPYIFLVLHKYVSHNIYIPLFLYIYIFSRFTILVNSIHQNNCYRWSTADFCPWLLSSIVDCWSHANLIRAIQHVYAIIVLNCCTDYCHGPITDLESFSHSWSVTTRYRVHT